MVSKQSLVRKVTCDAVAVAHLAVIAELLHETSDGIARHLAVGSNVGDRKAGGGVTAVLHNLQNSGRESLVHKFKEYEFNSRNSRKW